jgi:hypothetical protein
MNCPMASYEGLRLISPQAESIIAADARQRLDPLLTQ